MGPQGPGNGIQIALGAIQVVRESDPFFIFAQTPANTNVQITRNYIADTGRSGVWIGELNGGLLNENLIIRYSQNPTLGGVAGITAQDQAMVNQDALLPAPIHYSSSITQTENTIAATSPITAPVSLTISNATVQGSATTGNVSLQTAIEGFMWKPSSDSPWLTISAPALGVGNGTVNYSIAPNPTGIQRTGKIMIAGEVFSITQMGKKARNQVTSQ